MIASGFVGSYGTKMNACDSQATVQKQAKSEDTQA
jgi:hypothetical protein